MELFFPVYLRFFSGRPWLRIFAATSAAACVGNFYLHSVEKVVPLWNQIGIPSNAGSSHG